MGLLKVSLAFRQKHLTRGGSGSSGFKRGFLPGILPSKWLTWRKWLTWGLGSGHGVSDCPSGVNWITGPFYDWRHCSIINLAPNWVLEFPSWIEFITQKGCRGVQQVQNTTTCIRLHDSVTSYWLDEHQLWKIRRNKVIDPMKNFFTMTGLNNPHLFQRWLLVCQRLFLLACRTKPGHIHFSHYSHSVPHTFTNPWFSAHSPCLFAKKNSKDRSWGHEGFRLSSSTVETC